MSPHLTDRLRWVGIVRVEIDGQVWEFPNTVTDFAINALANWLAGVPNTNTATNAILYPRYAGLGSGSGTPAVTDLSLFAEVYGTRKSVTATIVPGSTGMNGNSLQIQVPYQTTDPAGTFTEAGFFDSLPAQLSLATSVAAGATSISVTANSVAWFAGERIYIADSTNPEYVNVSSSPPASGATTVPLAAGTQYAHSAGVPVYVFVGNLWAHSMFSSSVTKASGQLMTLTWQIGFSG